MGPQIETQGGSAVQLLVNPHVETTGTGTAQPTAPLQGNSNGGITDAQLLNQQQTQNNMECQRTTGNQLGDNMNSLIMRTLKTRPPEYVVDYFEGQYQYSDYKDYYKEMCPY